MKQLSNSIESVLDRSITELNKKIISALNEDKLLQWLYSDLDDLIDLDGYNYEGEE